MRKKFFKNLILLVFLNLLVKPIWVLGIDRTVQNVVGAEEYGFYFSLFSFSLLLNILLDVGITNFNNRNIAQHSKMLSKSLSNIVSLKFFLAIVYFAITLLSALFISYEWRQIKLLMLLVVNQFLASFILYLRSNISGLHYFKTDSLLSVLDRSLMIIICGFLLWGNIVSSPFKIEWFVYAQSLSYLITVLIAFIVVLNKAEFLKIRIDRKYFIAILKKSYPFALLTLLMAFYYRIDSVMLERMLPDGKEQAGIYAQAFRLLDAVTMFAFLFAGLLLPMFSRMIRNGEAVNKLTQFSFFLLIVPVIIFSVVSVSYSNDIIALLYKEHIAISANIYAILILCFIGISTSYIFGTLLTANGSLKYLNRMAIAGVSVNIILNLILIPKYQALGSAIASLVTQTLTALIQVLLVKKIFHFRINYIKISALIVFTVLVIIMSNLSLQFDFQWYYKILIVILISWFFAFILRLINLKVLYQMLRYKEE
ncbi:MAG: oligosaccharide flippase family protein [Bacteroidota bacterium]|nr:oligosaccharide flippase family protein [Bacteroidota bacterium]